MIETTTGSSAAVTKKPTILVVDDQPLNVKLLQHKLERVGMRVLAAYNGQECLDIVQESAPDLILLDIMMPDLDGMAVCRAVKEREDTRDLPIIFITAKSSKEGRIAGLDAGAADYITKPIDLEETVARVQTQLRIQENHRVNLDLQQRLANTRQAAAIGAVSQGIAHNLNNLLGVVVGYLDLLKMSADNPDRVRKSCDYIDQAIKRMTRIVRQLNAICEVDIVNVNQVPLRTLLHNSIERFRTEHQMPDAEINARNPFPDLPLETNAEVFEDSVGRLLINAIESYPAKAPKKPVSIVAESESIAGVPHLALSVIDEGSGISSAVMEHIFEPFVSGHTTVGRGMGLTIARHALRSLGGDLTVKNRPEGGAVARLTHPLPER